MFFADRINSIKATDKVLEIGPGGTPHPRADEFLDLDPANFANDLEASMQRGSAPELVTDKKVTYYDGKTFPYKDKQFDYVIASHVLEHVDDVKLFISELCRVGRVSYIEFPTVLYDYLYNIPVHLNFVHYDQGKAVLYFMKKSITHLNEFKELQAFLLATLASGHTTLVDSFKLTMFEGFELDSSKPIKVVETTDLRQILPTFETIKSYVMPKETVIVKDQVSTRPIDSFSKYEILKELAQRLPKKLRSVKQNLVNSKPTKTEDDSRQQSLFAELAGQFSVHLQTLEKLGPEPFVIPFWEGVNKKVKEAFSDNPPIDFLSLQILRDTMFVDGNQKWLETQTTYLKKRLKNFRKITREDPFGAPKLLPPPLQYTSHNTIHHLYHMLFFFEQGKLDASEISTVVEWGGGYGNMAKLWLRQFKQNTTYVIIDTALFTAIQWLYLGSIFGEEKVRVITSPDQAIVSGEINLVPLTLLESLEINADLFISTWGLSESAVEAQDYVVNRQWFGAKHLLIGYQDSTENLPNASRLGKLAGQAGAKIIDINFIPHNHYAIK